MTRSDRVLTETYYNLTGEVPDFVVDVDVRRNLVITFVNDCYFEPGEKITIVTEELQKDLYKEFRTEQKRLTRLKQINKVEHFPKKV